MKFCFIAQRKPSITYGGGKAQYYLARELKEAGHSVTLMGPGDFAGGSDSPEAFQGFLLDEGAQYDVVDFDHNFLLSAECSAALPDTLLVARSVLLQLHQIFLKYPLSRALKSRLRRFLTRHYRGKRAALFHQEIIDSLQRADLVSVSSQMDIDCAVNCGIARNKIVQFPFALEDEVVKRFQEIPTRFSNESPLIVFLGTFDFRKGCLDAVNIFKTIRQKIPGARLRILGAKGVFTNEKAIMELFPIGDRDSVELHMRFDPASLGELLGKATIGLFPSYHEGWPFAVMEQLAAGKPVIAYNAPGASEILPSEWLGNPGDWQRLATLCIEFLHFQEVEYLENVESARAIVKSYNWHHIANETLDTYTKAIDAKVNR